MIKTEELPVKELAENWHDLYWEAVGKVVDGIEAELMNGDMSQPGAIQLLVQHLIDHEWTDLPYAHFVLMFSKHPSAALSSKGLVAINRMVTERFIKGQGGQDAPFPANMFALQPMMNDCRAELETREAFQKAPEDFLEDE